MEVSTHLNQISLFAVILVIIICTWIFITNSTPNTKKSRIPEPAGAWPFIGHLLLLKPTDILHRKFGAMADEYGPIFSIKLGAHKIVVISSLDLAKECFTVHDRVFSNRPKSLAAKIMGYNQTSFGFLPYGPYWRDVRKLAVVELLSSSRLDLLKHVWDTEVDFFMNSLYGRWVGTGGREAVLVDLTESFGDLAMNIVVRMVAGKRYFGKGTLSDNESKRCQKAMSDFMYFVGLPFVSDAVPFLGWVDEVNGYKRAMRKTAKEIDYALGGWLKEHKQQLKDGKIDESKQDFIHVMLSVIEDNSLFTGVNIDTTIKATCLSLILGGSDTTVTSLTWAVALLLNNRQVIEKAQEELDVHVGRDRQVDESDIPNLIYLQAIVKETFRLQPTLPLAPRESVEDCTIAGFFIPSGTRLWVNTWKIQRDPTIWSDPLEFQPERFLGKHADVDIKGQHFELLPFGSGRRACPGIQLGMRVLQLTLARLLHGFELGTVSDAKVDLTERAGLTVPKATPLEVTLTPRLSSALYSC
jgi:hypothetical protein